MTDDKLEALARWARKPAVLPYGKYKGKRLSLVLADDPGYLGHLVFNNAKWVIDNLSRKDIQFCERSYQEREDWEEQWHDEIYNDIMWRD